MNTVEVRESISYESLADVIKTADYAIEVYENLKSYNDFEIEYDDEYGCTFPVLVYRRPETEAEKSKRERREAEHKAYRDKYEREQFELLKKKFENG